MGRIVVHPGRAHVDDFLASCVCVHRTGLPLHRLAVKPDMLEDPSCWVLDQGFRFEPELLNFDHHQTSEEICSLTMVLDHFYGPSYRDHLPQFSYIEIHDSRGSSKAAKFAGLSQDGLEVAGSLIQHFVLKAFSRIEGEVADPFYSIVSEVGSELCSRIETVSALALELDRSSRLVEMDGLKVLDVTGCETDEPDELPTKSWCKKNNLSPSVILTRDARMQGSYRLVSVDKSKVVFSKNPLCSFVHASGFLAVFERLEDWETILMESKKPSAKD